MAGPYGPYKYVKPRRNPSPSAAERERIRNSPAANLPYRVEPSSPGNGGESVKPGSARVIRSDERDYI